MALLLSALERALTQSNKPATLKRISRGLTRLVLAVDTKVRAVEARSAVLPEILSTAGETLRSHIRAPHPPWEAEDLGTCDVPGMVSPEECRYYLYISRFFSGLGEAVELGPWLGRSTTYICRGLAANSKFTGHKLHVYDDFVWRTEWMDTNVPASIRLPNHADFKGMFDAYLQPFAAMLDVAKCKITDFDGNERLPQLRWTGEPIEIMYVDCGRTYEANEAWWQLFKPSFMPNRTVLVLEDWNTHREVPVRWYNQLKQWVDSKGSALQPIDELVRGGIGSFLYKGQSSKAASPPDSAQPG